MSNLTSPEVLELLLKQHANALALFAKQWTSASEDCIQLAFIKLAARPCPDDPVCWLYKVVKNLALNQGRSERRRRIREQAAGQKRWFQNSSTNSMDSEVAVDLLHQLPPNQRQIVIAKIWGGLTFEQIGEVMKSSSSAVHRKYQSGLKLMRQYMQEQSCEAKT